MCAKNIDSSNFSKNVGELQNARTCAKNIEVNFSKDIGELKNARRCAKTILQKNSKSAKLTSTSTMAGIEQTIDHTIPIPYHLAMAVFDETIGKMMEMRDLVNHPDRKIREEWTHSVAMNLVG